MAKIRSKPNQPDGQARIFLEVSRVLDRWIETYATDTNVTKRSVITQALVEFLKSRGVADPTRPLELPWHERK